MKPTNTMLLEHIARYYFASPYCHGHVLDMACGSGYGTHMIAKLCRHQVDYVVGVDIDAEIVEYASKTYYHPLTRFMVGDAMNARFCGNLGTFDTILSFETIEHVSDDRTFLSQLYSLLKPGGTLVLSTPFGKGRGIPCGSPFHVHQLTPEQFQDLFIHFAEVEVYYQRGVTIEPPRKDVYYPLGVAVCVK
jgi:2-polyprenyl-3-methyl-5-hydroxy-6-metoxy-1,4-benzoquinol methylase